MEDSDAMKGNERAAPAVPLVPGVLPVTNFTTVKRFATTCGANIPDRLARRFEGLEDDADTRRLVAAAAAIELCDGLSRHGGGVSEFHFYTLNRAELTYAICHALGLRPGGAAATAP